VTLKARPDGSRLSGRDDSTSVAKSIQNGTGSLVELFSEAGQPATNSVQVKQSLQNPRNGSQEGKRKQGYSVELPNITSRPTIK
jgi:hypothetical protein